MPAKRVAPGERTVSVSVSILASQATEVQRISNREGVSVSVIVRELIADALLQRAEKYAPDTGIA